MPIGWMTVLKLVPWGEVIKNAPAVADGARKLWDTVGNKTPPEQQVAAPAAGTPPPDRIQARLNEAESQIAALHEQMQASSALIKALAEQNAELIRQVQANRVRLLWLAGGLGVLALIVFVGLAKTLPG
jgi:hypothetical protein